MTTGGTAAAFSPSDAALEGFQILRRQWRLVVGWAGFNLVAMVGVVVVATIVAATAILAAGGDSDRVGGPVAAVISIATAALQFVITVAIYRSVFRPQDRGFLYLRIGPDEARCVGAALIGVLAAAALVLVAVLVARAVRPIVGAAPELVGVVALAFGYWLAMRFGLVGPICVAERRLDFRRSWRLTRGKAWSLTGMSLLSMCLAALVTVVVWAGFFLVSLAVLGFRDLGGLVGPEGLSTHPGLYLLQATAPFLLAPVVLVIGSAPWAAAYQALAEPAAEA